MYARSHPDQAAACLDGRSWCGAHFQKHGPASISEHGNSLLSRTYARRIPQDFHKSAVEKSMNMSFSRNLLSRTYPRRLLQAARLSPEILQLK
jgi:hypothetical protein